MTDIKDFILIGTFIIAVVMMWLKVRSLNLNHIEGIKKGVREIRKDLADYKKERAREDIKIGERLSTLEACVKALKGDINRLNQK